MAYIHYDTKGNGVEYASVYESYRDSGKVRTRMVETLGRVVDKGNGIFSSRGKPFKYTVGIGRQELPKGFGGTHPTPERLILDFGDAWFLSEYVKGLPFCQSILEVLPDDGDTVMSLVLYRLLAGGQASCHARIWHEGSYASIAYPGANLAGQNISRVLRRLGQEEAQRGFFEGYMSSLYPHGGADGIIIDSTGVPNATKMDITQLSNHNGDISREVRVVYAIDRGSGMPIYFRYVPGNIVDVSTLVTTVHEIAQYGIPTKQVILDAGYFSEANAKALLDEGIPFLTRISSNRRPFKDAAGGNIDGLMSKEHAFRYGERLMFIKKVPTMLCGHEVFVYLCIDEDMYLMQHKRTMLSAMDEGKDPKEADEDIKSLGAFALLSSDEIGEDKLLPLYYTRQRVEQVFDISKNYAGMLPIRVQSEEAFRGHMLVCFIATAIMQRIQRDLLANKAKKAKTLNAGSIFAYLRNHKCKVYESCAIPQEARKEANAIYDVFKMDIPHKISLADAKCK